MRIDDSIDNTTIGLICCFLLIILFLSACILWPNAMNSFLTGIDRFVATGSIKVPEVTPGDAGRVVIKDLEIDTALYNFEYGSSQGIVDEENSALLLPYDTQLCIVDHGIQPWSRIHRAVPGKTILSIVNGDKEESYLCYSNSVGCILEAEYSETGNREILDAYGNMIRFNGKEGSLITICCLEDEDDMGRTKCALVYWQLLTEENDWLAGQK